MPADIVIRGGTVLDGSGAPGRVADVAIADRAPRLSEHNAYVLREILGLSAEKQQRPAEAGITR